MTTRVKYCRRSNTAEAEMMGLDFIQPHNAYHLAHEAGSLFVGLAHSPSGLLALKKRSMTGEDARDRRDANMRDSS